MSIDRESARPLYVQIAERLHEQIIRGEIGVGVRLPAERQLAADLGVNRSTVVAAYEELASAGLVDRHVGRGTTVIGAPTEPASPWIWLRDAPRSGQTGLAAILGGLGLADRISLEVAHPANDALPVEEFRAVFDQVWAEEGAEALSYQSARGLDALADAILERTGIAGDRGRQVIVTSGAMQGIDLVARALLRPGDEVAIESPSYPGALDAIRRTGARLIPVPIDHEGIRTDALARILARGSVRMVFVCAQLQNPSGVSLSPERAQSLLELTHRSGVPLVEDAVYAELTFDGRVAAPLLSYPDSEHVLLISSLSKVLAGGLRVGWVIGPSPLIDALGAVKQHADVNTSGFMQHVATRALRSGLLDRQLARVRPLYQQRLTVFTEALRAAAPSIQFRAPLGGLSMWCRLPGSDSMAFAAVAAAEGVGIVPGHAFSVGQEQAEWFRACFGNRTDEELTEAAARLGRAVARYGDRPLTRTPARPLL